MAADEVREVVGEDLIVRVDEAGDVFGLAEEREGRPAGEDDVDEHEDFLLGGVHEEVSEEVVFALVVELEGLVSEVEGV